MNRTIRSTLSHYSYRFVKLNFSTILIFQQLCNTFIRYKTLRTNKYYNKQTDRERIQPNSIIERGSHDSSTFDTFLSFYIYNRLKSLGFLENLAKFLTKFLKKTNYLNQRTIYRFQANQIPSETDNVDLPTSSIFQKQTLQKRDWHYFKPTTTRRCHGSRPPPH